MNRRAHGRAAPVKFILSLAGFSLVFLGLIFALPLRMAQASPPAQAGTSTGTPTATLSGTTTGTLTATANGTTTGTPSATANGTNTRTPAAGTSGTSTPFATLAAPAFSGTPTVLVPVTGADLTRPGGGSNTGMWIAIWLLGLLLTGFGAWSRLSKRQQ